MSEHIVALKWTGTADFDYKTYTRTHSVTFGGGSTLQASAAPDYLGDASLANPEEMLAAALSSCHMLSFLALAAKGKFKTKTYEDRTVAILGKRADGRLAIIKVILHPVATFWDGFEPTPAKLNEMHEHAHRVCFIANSVACEVSVEL